MLGSIFKDSLLHLTLLAFVLSCSAQAPAPTYKKTSSDSKKKPAQSDDDADESDEGSSDDAEAGDGDEEGSSGGDEDKGEPDSDEGMKDTNKPVDDGEKEPVVMKPVEPTPAENVASLDGYRWEMICERMEGTELCVAKEKKFEVSKTIAGKTGEVYEVELRFRGVSEPMKYKDGQKVGDRFYIGGTPDNGTYNIYAIKVSNPAQIYYLNWASDTGHDTFAIDYTAKIKMNAGATVQLIGDGQNDMMIANFKNAVAPGIEKLPMDNKGQFIQMNVVGAVLSN